MASLCIYAIYLCKFRYTQILQRYIVQNLISLINTSKAGGNDGSCENAGSTIKCDIWIDSLLLKW